MRMMTKMADRRESAVMWRERGNSWCETGASEKCNSERIGGGVTKPCKLGTAKRVDAVRGNGIEVKLVAGMIGIKSTKIGDVDDSGKEVPS